MSIPFGHAVIRSGTARVQGLITPGVARITKGDARFAVVNRDRRVGLVEYDGADPVEMEIPILLDGFRRGQSVEAACAALRTMCRPPAAGGVPPKVIAEGTLPILGVEWHMTMAWGEDVLMNPRTGHRTRQDAVITLIQPSAAQILAPKMLLSLGVPWVAYTVRKGDTLDKLAAKYSNTPAGRAQYVAAVRAKNNLRPGAKLPKVLKVPK